MAKIPGKKGALKTAKKAKQLKRLAPVPAKAKGAKAKPVAKRPRKAVVAVAVGREERRFDVRSKPPRGRSVIVAAPVGAVAPAVERVVLRSAEPEVRAAAIPHEVVARRAYEIWEAKVRRANDAEANWLEAEGELRAGLGLARSNGDVPH